MKTRISIALLPQIIRLMQDGEVTVSRDGPTVGYRLQQHGAVIALAVRQPNEGCARLTRARLEIKGDEKTVKKICGVVNIRPVADASRTLEFFDAEDERLDVNAPKLSDVLDAELIRLITAERANA